MSLAAIGLIAQTALGIGQTIAGAVKKKPIIPEADIPDEVFQNLSDAEYWSMIGMPPEQREMAVEDIQRSSASALSRSKDRRGGMGLISRIQQGETEGYRGVSELDTSMRVRNINRLSTARDRVAEERNRADDINRQIKFDERTERNQLIGSGIQNVMGALGTASFMDSFGGNGSPFGDPAKKAERKAGRAGRQSLRQENRALKSGTLGDVTYAGDFERMA